MAWILERVALMLDCFPERADAPAALGQASALAAILSEYPEMVVHTVTDPARGIAVKQKWRPLPFELKRACEDEMEPIRRQMERDRARNDTLLLGAPDLPSPERRKEIVDELVEKHGRDYGISHSKARRAGPPPLTIEQLRERAQTIEIEVSPALKALIQNQLKEETDGV